MSDAAIGLLKVFGVALVAILILGFAIATQSYGSAALFLGWIAFSWYLVRRSVRR